MSDAIQQMLNTIEMQARETAALTGRPSFAPKVMQALAAARRADFVPANAKALAYSNGPLPIGFGQTISQPYIVALMTDLLDLEPEHKVLEIGTGSGYQTAVLATLAGQIYSLERIADLADTAGSRLQEMGYTNVTVRHGNGYMGWPEHAPFDRIIVTAAAPVVPPALLEQLKPGGRLLIPFGEAHLHQQLTLITKNSRGDINTAPVLAVAFVPLVDD